MKNLHTSELLSRRHVGQVEFKLERKSCHFFACIQFDPTRWGAAKWLSEPKGDRRSLGPTPLTAIQMRWQSRAAIGRIAEPLLGHPARSHIGVIFGAVRNHS